MDSVERLCPRCGNAAGPARFCPHCGLRLTHNGTPALGAPARRTLQPLGTIAPPPGRVRVRGGNGNANGNGGAGGDGGGNGAALVAAGANGHGDANGHGGTNGTNGGTSGATPDPLGALAAAAPAAARRPRRRALMDALLELARGDQALEGVRQPIELAAAFLRRFEGRRRTQEAYADDLADWFSWLEQAGVGPFAATLATVESYSREPLQNGRPPAPATVARRLACLSHFYRRAVYAGVVRRNPLEQVQRPRSPEPTATLGLSKTRARRLLAAARAAGPRHALLVLLMLELGLRVSEAIGADIEDLSEQGRHRVLAIRGKGQATKASLVPLNQAVIEAVDRVIADRKRGPLLATATGRRLTRQHASKLIHHLGCRIGLPELHPHALRHAFVTLSLDEGGTLRDVQDAARHADPRTTRRYDTNRRNLERHPTHLLLTAIEPWRDGRTAAGVTPGAA